MSILFAINHDEPTKANFLMAQRIANQQDTTLFGPQATRNALLSAIKSSNSKELFLMSHGSKDGPLDENKKEFITRSDAGALAGAKVFAWACRTGIRIGHEMAAQGIIWWGYDAAVTAPDERERYAGVIANVFMLAKNNFHQCSTRRSVEVLLSKIREECESALKELDRLIEEDDDETEILSILSTCAQFWQRLSVWIGNDQKPLRHPLAPPAYIDI